MLRFQDAKLGEIATSLGLTNEALQACASAASAGHANSRLADLKADVKKAYRRRAIELHPDKGGDAEQFKVLAAAYSQIEKFLETLEFRFRNQVPGYQVIRVRVTSGPVTTSSTTTTTHFTSDWWNRTVT
jgi:hypothetical protein